MIDFPAQVKLLPKQQFVVLLFFLLAFPSMATVNEEKKVLSETFRKRLESIVHGSNG